MNFITRPEVYYNVISRRVVPPKSRKYEMLRVCVSVLALVISHANRIFSAPCDVCHLWPVVSTIFSHIILQTAQFRKKILNIKCVF
jgi:hypothetical protein